MLCKLLPVLFLMAGLVAGRVYVPVSTNTQMFFDSLEAQCKKVGAENKFEDVKQAFNAQSECMIKHLDIESLAQLRTTQDIPVFVNAVTKVCDKKKELRACTSEFYEAMVPCMSASDKVKTEDILAAVNELGDYVCQNNAEAVKKLLEDNAIECFRDHTLDLAYCVSEAPLHGTEKLSEKELMEKLETLRSCTVGTLNKCPKSTAADFLDRVFKMVQKSSTSLVEPTVSVNRI